MITMTSVAVTAISFGVNTKHTGYIGAFDKNTIEPLLPEIVEFIGEYSARYSDRIISFFSDDTIEHFGKPPDTLIELIVPFLCHLLPIAKMDKLISTRIPDII